MRSLPRSLFASLLMFAAGCTGGGGGGIGDVTLEVTATELFQTETVTFTLAVENAPSSDLVVDLSSSNPSVLDVPASATISAGQTSTTFSGTALLVGGPIQVSAEIGDPLPSVSVTVLDPPEISLTAVTPAADQASTGSLIWSGTATHARALDPAEITVETVTTGLAFGTPVLTGDEASFQLEVPYTLAVDTVPGLATIVVDANGAFVGGDATTDVFVRRIPRLESILPAATNLDTTEVRAFSANLDQMARNGGETVALLVSDGTKLTIPAMVTVTAGGLSAPISVTATATGGPVTLSGTLADTTRQSSVTISDAVVTPQTFSQNAAYQGQSIFVMVTGTGSSYVAVNLSTATLTPPAGLTLSNVDFQGTHVYWTLGFQVDVDPLATSGVKQIAFDANGAVVGGMANIPFTVRDIPRVASIGPDGTVIGGGGATMSVLLTAPARPGGEAVVLSDTSGTLAFSSPLLIATGSSSGTFSVGANVPEGVGTLTASLNGGSDSTTITVQPDQQGLLVVSEVLSLGTSGEAVEVHTRFNGPEMINGWFIQIGTGPLQSIRSVSTPTSTATAVVVTSLGFAWGVPNPANPSDIPASAGFVYGDPGTTAAIADGGDRVRLWSATNVLQDEVDMRGMFVSDGSTPLGASTFPGHPGRTTQLRSTLADDSTLKDENDDGGNWCVTFHASNTLGAINQACSEVVINELFYDSLGADDMLTFVELAGGGGTFIGGNRVLGLDQNGVTQQNVLIGTAVRIPSDGIYVMADSNAAGATMVPNADMVNATIDAMQNGPDDAVQLRDAAMARLDALQYGTLLVTSNGEGAAAPDVAAGLSLARDEVSTDTNDNATDFDSNGSPTPGTQNWYRHAITIDGTNDFVAGNERFATTSVGFDGYYSWDDTYFYFGMNGSDINANSSSKWLIVYLSGAPGAPATMLTEQYNTQQASLPFGATYQVQWQTTNAFTNIRQWTGSNWTNSGISIAGDVFRSGTFLEMRVRRAELFGTATRVRVHMAMLNEAPAVEATFAGVPSTSFSDGYDPDFTRYFEFDLLDSKTPVQHSPLP